MIIPGPRSGSAEPTYTTTIITSSQTFDATVAGVHRFMLLGSGATAPRKESVGGSGGGGACPVPLYLEFDLTVGQAVTIAIAGAASAPGTDRRIGNVGNITSITVSGVSYSTPAAAFGALDDTQSDSKGGRGWARGGDGGGSGSSLDGNLLAFLSSRFPGVVLTSGAAGPGSGGGHRSGGGAAGLLIDGTGPAGTSSTSITGGRGEGYGAGAGADAATAQASNPGVVLIGVPG